MTGNQPTNNQGSNSLLRTDAVPDIRSYLKFDIQNLSGAANSATLRIFALDTKSAGFEVYAVADNSWEENTITYSAIPATGTLIASSGATTANSWSEIDVTSFMTGNGEWSIVLVAIDDSLIRFRSRESNVPPELVIETGSGSMNAPTTTSRSSANTGKNNFE